MAALVSADDLAVLKGLFEHAEASLRAREETDRRRAALYERLLRAEPAALPSLADELARLTRREDVLLRLVDREAETLRRVLAQVPSMLARTRGVLPAKPSDPAQQRLEYQVHAIEFVARALTRALERYEESVQSIRERLERERALEESVRAGQDPRAAITALRRLLALEDDDFRRLADVLGELPDARRLVSNLGIGSVAGVTFRTTTFLDVASGVSVLAGSAMAAASVARGSFAPDENLLGIGGVACLVAGAVMYLIRSSEYAQRVAIYEREALAHGLPPARS